jgi:hypothetical protein
MYMAEKEDYKLMMGEIIARQSVILGPEMAIMRARGVKGLTVTELGEVSDIEGEPKDALQHLIDQYVELSGQIVRATLGSIFQKYPSVGKGDIS